MTLSRFFTTRTVAVVFVLSLTVVIGALTFSKFTRAVTAQEPQKKPAATASTAAEQDPDVIRVDTDLVLLNATVLDKNGKFVSSLRRSDFRVLEDGQQQQILSFGAEETPFAAAILIDISGSMESRMTLARSAASRFLEGLREEDVAAVYSFNNKVEQWQDFSPGSDLPDHLFGLQAKGMTVLNDAVMRSADDLAQRAERRRAIVVLSDGGENFSRASTDKALDHALQAGATIYAVNMSEEGPTRDIQGSSALKNFADRTGGRYVAVPGGQPLRDAFAQIAEELSHQYTITYRSTNRQRDGKWRAIDVKVSRPDPTVRTRKGYRAPKS